MIKLEKLTDEYYKEINSENSELNSGQITLSKMWNFDNVSLYSPYTSLHNSDSVVTFDCLDSINSLSAYYHSILMKSYQCGAINRWDGTHVFTLSVTSLQNAVSHSVFHTTPVFVPSICSVTANLSSLYVFTVRGKYIGDRASENSFEVFSDSNRLFYSQKNNMNDSVCYVIPDTEYFNIEIDPTRYLGWGLPDYGIYAIWTDIPEIVASMSADVSCFKITGNLGIHNITANIVIDPEEFCSTNNSSFTYVNSKLNTAIANTTYISGVGLYNKWGELLAVAKPSVPIRKYLGVPITIKLSFDL